MARKIKQIADALGAEIVGRIADVGGGAFGAARLPHAVAALKDRLRPAQGLRPGRPTEVEWVHHPKVPMSEKTARKLRRLAGRASTPRRKISPMQLAAQLLEDAVATCQDD